MTTASAAEFRPGRPDDRISMVAGVPYLPAATCPRWLSFLQEVFIKDDKTPDKDLIEWIQRAVGYSATGLVSEQVCFILYGSGCNGKDVFLSALRHVFGDYAYNTSFATFEKYRRRSIDNDFAALAGRRFITASETSESSRFNENRIKSFVHGDAITARFLFNEEFTYEPAGKLWLAVNHLPAVGDRTGGFWRSVAIIPFNATFTEATIDRRLSDKLKNEGSGILNWIVTGCVEWQKKGLRPYPKVVKDSTADYQKTTDDLAEFIADRLDVTVPESYEKASALYRDYQEWCEENKLPKDERLGSKTFYQRIGQAFARDRKSTSVTYLGLHLRQRGQQP